jgi:hypothetical protein
MSNIIILRSVFGKVGQTYTINPCIDPNTGMYPPHVKTVDKNNDMILSEKDKSSGTIFIKETEEISITDGTVFDLTVPIQKAKWEAIKNSSLIAPDRFAHDKNGDSIIDGNTQKYGVAVLYIERPGEESKIKNSRKKLITQACNYIFQDSKENQVTKCKLLGKDMRNAYASDIEDFLINYAEKFPQKIIDLYTGSDTSLRLLFVDALNKGILVQKQGIYMYGDRVNIGITDDACIIWMKQKENQKFVELIKKDTYPELYTSES